MLCYVFAFVDRQVLTLLVAPIRRDLEISDPKMSVLMGASFAIFYTLFGIPLGRLADRGPRRPLIAAGMVLWSLATAACGLARRFFDLLLLRIGVGVGEAALSPAAYSLIADSFPPAVRATAISVYSMGIYVGGGLALLLTSLIVGFASGQEWLTVPLLGPLRPWQVVLLVVGLLGLPVALLLATIHEPARRRGAGPDDAPAAGGAPRDPRTADGLERTARSLAEDVLPRATRSWIARHRATFLCHNLGFALLALAGYANNAWIPTFLVRRHGWSMEQAGVVFGAIVAACGTAGVLAGGRLADRMTARGRRDAPLRVGLLACLLCLPFSALYPLAPSGGLAAVLVGATILLTALPFGVAPAGLQDAVPVRMRAQAAAVYLFVVNLVGLGLGPSAVALLTNHVFHDDRAVHASLLVVGVTAQLGAALLLWRGMAPWRACVEEARGREFVEDHRCVTICDRSSGWWRIRYEQCSAVSA